MRKTKHFLEGDVLEALNRSSSTKKVMLKISFLLKCQTGSLQPSLKRDFDANIFPVNVEKFSK